MLINGAFADSIDAGDRGLAYGDGLFETIRTVNGQPVLLSAHIQRLRDGCESLGIEAPVDELQGDIRSLLSENQTAHAVLKIIVTRGVSGRGYRFEPGGRPTRIVSISEYIPDRQAGEKGISAMLCDTRLALNPRFAGIKHLNRLEQVMAAGELPESCQEGLMMNLSDELIEGTKTNLFIVEDKQLITPGLDGCGVNGTMRQFLLDRMTSSISPVSMVRLNRADEVFVCNSVVGIWPVTSLLTNDGQTMAWTVGPVTQSVRQLVEAETGISG